MTKIDNFDSLQHLDFPTSRSNDSGDKFGAFLMATIGIFGFLLASNPNFQLPTTDSVEKDKVNKFWLSTSSLNAETTAFNLPSIPNNRSSSQVYVSKDVVTAVSIN